MKKLLIGLIKLYQATPGSWHLQCRHLPTCSNYAIEAIDKYGAFTGTRLAFKRIIKCRPGGTKGYDPVPIIERKKK